MTRKQLEDLGLSKEQVDSIMKINGDDIENHKRVIQFMMNNNLIQKTKTGRYYNNSFKFDDQTCAGEYGANFEGKIKLDEFIDLKTGRWIREEA